MGIGIDVTTRTMHKEGGNNEKEFTILLDTYTGKATDPYRKQCGPRTWKDAALSQRESIYGYAASWLEFIHNDVINGCRDHIAEKAFAEDGSVRVNMTVFVGAKDFRHCFIEVTKDGYYMYADAKDIDAGDRDEAQLTDNAHTVIKLYAGMAVAASERRMAREAFVDSYVREDRLVRDKIKRQLKNASNEEKPELKKALAYAQKVLDEKRDRAREMDEYKALLVPGPMENLKTIPMAAA